MKKGKNNSKEIYIDEDISGVVVENKSGFNTVEVIAIIIVSILFGVVIGSIITSSKSSVSTKKVSSELQEFVVTYNNLLDNYYGDIEEKDLVNAAIKGMISSLDDPYSLYMDSDETDEFNETVDGSYVGIGVTVANKDGNNYIVSMFDDSPSKEAGLKVGDIFVKINDKDVSSISLDELTSLIKGKAGEKVTVTVLRDNQEITEVVTRKKVDIPSVSSKIFEKDDHNIGYIYISTFAANTYKQFKSTLNKLENKEIDSLVIDVRSNPGGHLNQVTDILELFMDKSSVLYQVEVKGKKTKKYSTTNTKRDYNVAVIINSASASASEILAAAFKESYSNSFIVGVRSYGKGTVQKAYQLSNGSSVKYTTEKWLTPKGNWIDKAGVTPDFSVEQGEEYQNNPTDDLDTQLQKALEVVIKKES